MPYLRIIHTGGRSRKYNATDKTVISEQSISAAFGMPASVNSDPKAAYYDKGDGNVYIFDSTQVNKACFCSTFLSILPGVIR